MFEIEVSEDGRICLRGRFDAAQTEKANEILDAVESSVTIDFSELDYISSSGIGALFAVHKRLLPSGDSVKFVNVQPMVWDILTLANFHKFIEMEPAKEMD